MKDTFHDIPYLRLLEDILNTGVVKGDRTGTGTISTFGKHMRFDLSDGTIPLLTTKKMFLNSIYHELLWYIRGDTNIKYLNDNNVHIWDSWAKEDGSLGPVYGGQMRAWKGADGKIYDQLQMVIDTINTNPNDRRMVVSYWDISKVKEQALPPCHYSWQVYCDTDKNEISMIMNQRSVDFCAGNPFNIAQYSILLYMIGHVTGYKPKEFIWNGGDVHIYANHVDQARAQLRRMPFKSPLFRIKSNHININDITIDDFELKDYEYHPHIPLPIAV